MIQFSKLKELETELKIRGFTNQTIKTYLYHNQKFLNFVNSPEYYSEYQKTLVSKGSKRTPQDITNKDLKAYLAFLRSDKGLSNASTNLAISALKYFYFTILKKNIFDEIEHPPKRKKLPVVLTKDEIKQMIDLTKNKKHKLLIELLYCSGVRVSEAVNLRVKDVHIDEKEAFIKYGKGEKERFVKLSNAFLKHLQSYLKKHSGTYIFTYRKKPITPRQAQRIVKNAAKRANITKKVFCHALRSSFATHLLDSGTDIRVIQELLGHEHLETTQIYTKVSKKHLIDVKSPHDTL